MDVFELLEAGHHRIEQQLAEFIADYDQMSNAKKLERASLIFGEITKHFKHQESLISTVSNDQNVKQPFIDECLKDRKNITDAKDNLLMSHVDDADFSDGLRALLGRFDAHLKHYANKLFVEFRQQMSPQEVRTMDSQATEWMLGSV